MLRATPLVLCAARRSSSSARRRCAAALLPATSASSSASCSWPSAAALRARLQDGVGAAGGLCERALEWRGPAAVQMGRIEGVPAGILAEHSVDSPLHRPVRRLQVRLRGEVRRQTHLLANLVQRLAVVDALDGLVVYVADGAGCATLKWRGVKNSKKAARSLRTRTSGRSASHAGRGETRLRAADCLGAAALYTSSASGKLPSCLFLSAFICVHLRPICGFGFRVGPEEKHIWPQMNADERG